LSEVHHYETKEVKTDFGMLLLQEGLWVDANYTFKFTDDDEVKTLSGANILTSVSTYQFEIQKNDSKRNIYVLRSNYLQTVFSDMRDIMTYTNSSQYIDNRTKKGDNLRILSPR